MIGSLWPGLLLLCSWVSSSEKCVHLPLATDPKSALKIRTLTPVWSCDSPHPSGRWENSYGPGGIRQPPRVRDCMYCPSRCPSPGHTWTAHPRPHRKRAPPSDRPPANFRATLPWNESWRLMSAGGSGNWESASMGRTRRASG